MSRDYRYGHRPKNGFERKSQLPAAPEPRGGLGLKVWLFSGVVFAAMLGGFLIVQHFMVNQTYADQTAKSEIYTDSKTPPAETVQTLKVEALSTPANNEVAAPSADESSPSKPRYSFYQGLKETEVVVDAVPLSVALEDAYYIHAGTFGSEAVARKEQQRLANLGEAVELSVLQSGERTYYRLHVGPFHDRLAMNKRRNALRRLGVDTLLVKAPKN